MLPFTRQILSYFIGEKQAVEYLSGYTAKNSVLLFFMHCFAILLVFSSNYLVIRVAGVKDYGVYVYIFNLLSLLAGFCIVGTDTLLIKQVAVYDVSGRYGEMKGVILYSIFIAIIGSLIFSIASGMLAGVTDLLSKVKSINWFVLSFVTLLILSLSTIYQASLQGYRKIVYSQLGDKIVKPGLVILFVLILFYLQKEISLQWLIRINVTAFGLAMILTFTFYWQTIGKSLKNAMPRYELFPWFRSSMAFFLLNVLSVTNSRIDVFMLGLYREGGEVGTYNIALRISEIVGFSLVIINFVIAPVIAKLYERGEFEKMQSLVTRSARAVLAIGSVLLIIIVLFRIEILSFFGIEFLKGTEALLILCIGQFVNVFFGSVGTILLMTGYQKYSIISIAAGTIMNILLNVILIPGFGLLGTAIATASSMILWNLMMYIFIRKKLGIHTTAFRLV